MLYFYVLAELPFKDGGDVLLEPAAHPTAVVRDGEGAV